MSSGEQPCQHPPRECPCPPGALTQLTGEVWEGGGTPHRQAALQPAWLTHTICSGLRDRAAGRHIFCIVTLVWHLFHMTACGLPTVFLSMWFQGKSVPCPEEKKNKTLQNLAGCWNAWNSSWQLCGFVARGCCLLKNSSDFATYSP